MMIVDPLEWLEQRDARRADADGSIVGIDAESNGLHGQVFCAAAVHARQGHEVSQVTVRCPVEGAADPWVAENVLPRLAGVPVTHSSYAEMCDALFEWLDDAIWATDGTRVVAHVAWPVETRLLSDIYDRPGREFRGPYPLLDTASLLAARSEPEPMSDDAYLRRHGIWVPGEPHHPLRDARAAVAIWRHATGGRRVRRSLGRTARDRAVAKARW